MNFMEEDDVKSCIAYDKKGMIFYVYANIKFYYDEYIKKESMYNEIHIISRASFPFNNRQSNTNRYL